MEVLGKRARMAAGFAVDPFIQNDRVPDPGGPLAVSRQIFRQLPVALGGIRAKAGQHIAAQLSSEPPAKPVIANGLVTSDQSRIGRQSFQSNRT
jgi:hypothetical protein